MDQDQDIAIVRRFLAWLETTRDYRLCERGVADTGAIEWTPEAWTPRYCLADYERHVRQVVPAS